MISLNLQSILQRCPRWARRHKVVKVLILIFRASPVQLIRFNGSGALFADVTENDARNSLITGVCDPEFLEIARPFLPDKSCFFDVGANAGFYSFGLVGNAPGASLDVHLFEANPKLCGQLRRSTGLHPRHRITVNCVCVTDEPGTSRLSVKSDAVLAFVSPEGEIEVPNLVLDDYMATHGVSCVDLMKVDVEGWELHVLRGARSALRSGKVKSLYIEIATPHLRRAGTTAGEVLGRLEECGFDVYWCKTVALCQAHEQPPLSSSIGVNGVNLRVDRVRPDALPREMLTDWLAIHRSLAIQAI